MLFDWLSPGTGRAFFVGVKCAAFAKICVVNRRIGAGKAAMIGSIA